MMKKLRVGVVGVGHIGSNHARLYSEIPSAEFAAVYDIDRSKAAAIAQKYNVKAAQTVWEFGDMVDAASVATPTTSHYDVARSLLQCGKHVLIEKPITESTGQASELATMASTKNLEIGRAHV